MYFSKSAKLKFPRSVPIGELQMVVSLFCYMNGEQDYRGEL